MNLGASSPKPAAPVLWSLEAARLICFDRATCVFGLCNRSATLPSRRRFLRQVVLEHDEHLPFVAVWVVNPSLVLGGIAAVCFHLISCNKPALHPLLTNLQHIVS